jgi:hypothetical protein
VRLSGRLRVLRTRRFKEIDLLPRREGTSPKGWQPTADALLTMERRMQLVAAGRNGFGLFSRFRGPADLPLVAAGCNHGLHKGSIRPGVPPRAAAAGSADQGAVLHPRLPARPLSTASVTSGHEASLNEAGSTGSCIARQGRDESKTSPGSLRVIVTPPGRANNCSQQREAPAVVGASLFRHLVPSHWIGKRCCRARGASDADHR